MKTESDYKPVYREVYDYHMRHIPSPETPEEWDAAVMDMKDTLARCNDDPFAVAMLVAAYQEIANESESVKVKPSTYQIRTGTLKKIL